MHSLHTRLHKHPELEGQYHHTTLNVVAAATVMMMMMTTMKQLAAAYKVAERLLRLKTDARPIVEKWQCLAAADDDDDNGDDDDISCSTISNRGYSLPQKSYWKKHRRS